MNDPIDFVAFHAVVEHGGFSAAARVLRTPKGTLSKRVARLETLLGVRLLERSTRHVRLTDVGREIFEQAQLIVSGLEGAAAVAAETQAEPNGLVRLSSPQGLIQDLLSEILPSFLRSYPKVRVHLLELNRPADLVADGVDLALRARLEVQADASLVVRRMGREAGILVAAPQWLNQQVASPRIDDLARLPLLSMSDAAWDLVGPSGETQRVMIGPRLVCSNVEVLRTAATEGMGVALLPEHSCRASLASGTLQQILPTWKTASGTIYAVFSTRRTMTPALRALIDFLAQEIGRRSAPL